MKQLPSSLSKEQEELVPHQSPTWLRRHALKVCLAILALAMLFALPLTLFRTYGADTHHPNRDSIWWPERGRNLIPPGATDITLQRKLLDHYAIYTISENDLNAFLDDRFASDGEVLDSFSEREPSNPRDIGKVVGRLGWIAMKGSVVYSYSASNGGAHSYYHDPNTGLTYQSSAYW